MLYATDLSENSIYAFRYALQSAINADASIVILHVLEEVSRFVHPMVETYLSDDQRQKMFDEKTGETKNCVKEHLRILCKGKIKDAPECPGRISSIEV